MRDMNRLLYLDSLRGFAILLVIVGHLIQFNYKSSINNPIFDIIYSFHMPLFFFLSGCTNYLSEIKRGTVCSISDLSKRIKQKFISLIIPSVCWTILVPNFFSNTFSLNDKISGYWFLNTLFFVFVIWEIYSYITNCTFLKKYAPFLFSVLLVALFIFGIKRISLMYLIMFICGYVFQRYNLIDKINNSFLFILAILFCGIVGYFDYGDTTLGNASRVWLEFPISLVASLLFITIFKKNNSLYYRFSQYSCVIGKYSLGIYLSHFLIVVNIPLVQLENHYTLIFQFIILFVIAIFIAICCMLLQKIVSTVPYLHLLMFGK